MQPAPGGRGTQARGRRRVADEWVPRSVLVGAFSVRVAGAPHPTFSGGWRGARRRRTATMPYELERRTPAVGWHRRDCKNWSWARQRRPLRNRRPSRSPRSLPARLSQTGFASLDHFSLPAVFARERSSSKTCLVFT